MLWVSGCPYCDFQHVKRLHVAHHIDRADTTSFHYKAELRALPRAIKGTVLAMEYCLVPIIEMLMHVRVALRPLVALHDPKVTARHRATAAVGSVAVATIWLGLFACGGMYALAQYAAAAILMLHVLSAHDAFQHTYIVLTDDDTYVPGPGDRTAQYEDSNTYSNLISVNYPLLNLLSLNFGYHNAHHVKPTAPWFDLPTLHRERFGENPDTVIRLWPQLVMYHRYRRYRIFHDAPGLKDVSGKDFLRAAQSAQLTGGNAASFLTSF